MRRRSPYPAAQLSEALDHTRGICSTPMRLTLFVVVATYAAGGNDEQEPSDNELGRMSLAVSEKG